MKKTLLFLSVLTLLLSPLTTRASLGDKSDTVEVDRKKFSATHKSSRTTALYTVEEMENPSGTIRQYISLSGVVFGVAWVGRVHPDLNTLLNTYAAEYRAARNKKAHERGRRPRKIQGESVVVETWGHMRKLQGHAYLPSLIPVGVNPNEIQ